MRIRIFVILLFVVSFSKTNAQKFELGKVSIAELEEKSHPIDSSATAAILFKKARTYFSYDAKNGFSIHTEQIYRIKIYKKEGLNWANYKVPYRIGYEKGNNDMIEFDDCVTYNLENGNIVKTKLNSEGSFKTNVNQYWKEASITMPNVKTGSVIEFKYVLKSENILQFPVFNFQQDIPVNYAEYQTEIPGFFTYKAIKKGFLEIKSESSVIKNTLTYESKLTSMNTEAISFQQLNSKYVSKNIPALKEEPFVDNIENYRSSIFHELEKEKFNDEPLKDYSLTWEGVAKTIYEDKDFGGELKERKYIDQDLAKILKNEGTQMEKMEVIFKFVQNKMNWNGQKGYYTDKGVKQAYIDGIGNAAEINFVLMAMLNRSGIKAEPVLISTLEHGIPVYPNRTVFNYVFAAAEIEGKRILLDATNKYTTHNVLPLYTLNWTGRLIREDGSSEEIKLEPNSVSKKTINMMVFIDGNGKLSGNYRVLRTDYEAFAFRNEYSGINKENYLEKVEGNLAGLEISDYTIDNIKDLSKPIVENFTFKTDNQCEIIGDKMYINPRLFFSQSKNPFVQEKREFPIYFGYPDQDKFNINIDIPQGYVVESIPKPIKIQTGENVGSFVFNCATSDNKIQIVIVNDVNEQLVSSDFYDVLKGFYQQMIDKQNEKIVLKKI